MLHKNLFAAIVPANKTVFAGACLGKWEFFRRNQISRLAVCISPQKQILWPNNQESAQNLIIKMSQSVIEMSELVIEMSESFI